MISYEVMTKRYKELQRKYKNIKNVHAKEIRHKNKEIDNLKYKIVKLTDEIDERAKIIREKNLIIGALLSKIKM